MAESCNWRPHSLEEEKRQIIVTMYMICIEICVITIFSCRLAKI